MTLVLECKNCLNQVRLPSDKLPKCEVCGYDDRWKIIAREE